MYIHLRGQTVKLGFSSGLASCLLGSWSADYAWFLQPSPQSEWGWIMGMIDIVGLGSKMDPQQAKKNVAQTLL